MFSNNFIIPLKFTKDYSMIDPHTESFIVILAGPFACNALAQTYIIKKTLIIIFVI